MGKKILITIGIILLALVAGWFLLLNSLKPEQEESIAYESNVVKSIDEQLKGLPMDKIREKESLVVDKSIDEIKKSIGQGKLTYEEWTAIYLDRIKRYDKVKNGVNSVVEINPKAIKQAKSLDLTKLKGDSLLVGVPVLLKDNINTNDMPTSAGTYALKDFVPKENAPVVDMLKKNNAIILGKANLSELANYFSTKMPSGYSSKNGQTHNPFNPLKMSPLGSSAGSAAAVAANFCAVALGTETTGSITAPAYIQSIVGFKPTKDVISGEGVVPLSSTMDTVGPMGKTVKDTVQLFNASITDQKNKINISWNKQDLKGKRIGVLKDEESSKVVEALKKVGAIPVEVEIKVDSLDSGFIILQDFAKDYEQYAKKYDAPIKTLKELVEFNKKDLKRRARYGQNLLEEAGEPVKADKEKLMAMIKEDKEKIKEVVEKNKLDAIAFFNNNGAQYPCAAGYPEITVPLGKSENGEPVGITFFAQANEDEKLANIAYAFEQSTNARMIPEEYKKADTSKK